MSKICIKCRNSSRLHCTTFNKPISCFSDKQIKESNYLCYNATQYDYIDSNDTWSDPLTEGQVLSRKFEIISKHVKELINPYEFKDTSSTISWEQLAEIEYEESENYYNNLEDENIYG